MRFLIPVAALLLASPALAQTGAEVSASMEARLEAAERYVRGPAMKEMLDQMLSADGMLAQMQMSLPSNGDPEARRAMAAMLMEEFAKLRPMMEEAMIRAAAETFTLAELEAAATFYETPEGRGMAAKTNAFNQAFLELYAPIMQTFMANVEARMAQPSSN